MLVRPTPDKAQKLKSACKKLLTKPEVTIQELADVIGLIVSIFPEWNFGPDFIEGWNGTNLLPSHTVKGIFLQNYNCPQMPLPN